MSWAFLPPTVGYISNVCQFSSTVLIKVKALCQETTWAVQRSGARKLGIPQTLGVFKLWRAWASLRKAGSLVPGTLQSLLIMSPWEQMSDVVFSEL